MVESTQSWVPIFFFVEALLYSWQSNILVWGAGNTCNYRDGSVSSVALWFNLVSKRVGLGFKSTYYKRSSREQGDDTRCNFQLHCIS